MKEDHFTLQTKDGTGVFVYKWTPESAPKGIIQISHGMAEHAGRYRDFALALSEQGYAVFANDHRGHGKTAGSIEKLGYFADKDGWNLVVEDMHSLTNTIKEQYQDLPVFLFGHSMGSFLSRHYIILFGQDIAGVILSGTSGNPGLLGAIGKTAAKCESGIRGKKAKSGFMTKMSFGSFNKAFKPNRTDYDWLSRDHSQVDKYIDDPCCGTVFSAGFYVDLLKGLQEINKFKNIIKIPKNLPVYLFSGEQDPVGDMGKGVKQTHKIYKKAGISDLSIKLYPEGRHEMLNETNKEEVYNDVINWLDSHI